MDIKGRRALVTGASSGIGREIARALAQGGAEVLGCGSSPERVEAAREELGIPVECCDLTEAEDRRALTEAVEGRSGGLDILIHCAGMQQQLALGAAAEAGSLGAEEVAARMARELELNLLAPMVLTEALLPLLLRAEQAAVVNVSSVLALTPKQGAPVYCASKAGLASWTRALRGQLEGRGVLVMELMPPLVATAMTRGRDAGAISPEAVARACVAGLRADATLVAVGKARLARWLHRVAPGILAARLRHA